MSVVDIHSWLTNRIFDLGDEAERIMEGYADWDESRLQEIARKLTTLEAKLEGR